MDNVNGHAEFCSREIIFRDLLLLWIIWETLGYKWNGGCKAWFLFVNALEGLDNDDKMR